MGENFYARTEQFSMSYRGVKSNAVADCPAYSLPGQALDIRHLLRIENKTCEPLLISKQGGIQFIKILLLQF